MRERITITTQPYDAVMHWRMICQAQYEDEAAMFTARDGQNPGKSRRSVTDPYHDSPYYLRVEAKGGILWLSRKQAVEILKRGRRWRKAMAQWQPKRSA